MNFEQFLEMHYIADFAWELFKGISPTVIALITIWINTIIGKKKAEREKFSEEIKELQLMVSNITIYVVETGEFLLEFIQNGGKLESAFEAYYSKNKQMLKESRKYMIYANVRAEILKKENIKFDYANTAIKEYSHELVDILEWYNEEAKKRPTKFFDLLFNEVQHKLIDATTKVENVLVNYCMRMNFDEK